MYKYSKLAKECYPSMSMDRLIELQETHNSCTGKTTSQILGLISYVLANPERKIKLVDYFDCSTQVMIGSGGILDCLQDILTKLGLKYITIAVKDLTITYRPYGYVTKSWVEYQEVQY